MKHNAIILGIAFLCASCTPATTPMLTSQAINRNDAAVAYQRVVMSADMVTYWDNAGDDNEPKTKLSDASYILFQKGGKWHLTEQSIRMGSGIHHINKYGVISNEEAQRILTAASQIAQTEEGAEVEYYPPGGAGSTGIFRADLYTQASMDNTDTPWKWKSYKSNDAQNEVYCQLLIEMRAVAKKHGSILPLVAPLEHLED